MALIGLNSRLLAPHAKSIIGVDISQAMVEKYNLKVSNQGISPDEMRAICVDLKGETDELDGMKFDVVMVRPCIIQSSYAHVAF